MIIVIIPILINVCSYWWNHLIVPVNVIIAPIAPIRGHGLWFTMWNVWFMWFVILIDFSRI